MSNEERRGSQIAICIPDNCGRLIGKRLPIERLPEALANGMPMPNFHLVTGIDNKPFTSLRVTGIHTGFRNGRLRADRQTRFRVPGEPSTDYFIADALDSAGVAVDEAPRAMLKRQIARLESLGMRACMASELEFYLFDQSYSALAEQDYGALKPYHHRHGDNDLFVTGIANAFLSQLVDDLADAGIVVDQIQGEGGTGQLEVNIKPAEPLKACDQHAIFKHVVKTRALLAGRSVTFMAKPFQDNAGSGAHVHLGLATTDGRVLLEEGEPPGGPAAAFIAGILAHTGAFMALHAPYANSYRRLRRGSFTPLNGGWAWDNRSCMVRLTGSGAGARLEFRLPGADANPYFIYTGLIAAGIAGVDENLALPEPVSGDSAEAPLKPLPRDLTEALQRLEASPVAAAALGAEVHTHLVALAREELETERGLVTDWDRRRFLEPA
jgi:glutamine synthetase